MNFQNLNFEFVEAPHWFPPREIVPSAHTIRDDSESGRRLRPSQYSHERLDYQQAPSLSAQSLSPQPTILREPPSPTSSAHSSAELYGPERLFGLSGAFQSERQPQPTARALMSNQTVRFDEAQLAMFAADNAARMDSFKDELALAAGKVTPGVDDTPYIQYALDALTRDRGSASTSQIPIPPPPLGKYSEEDQPRNSKFMVNGFATSPESTRREQSSSHDMLHSPLLHECQLDPTKLPQDSSISYTPQPTLPVAAPASQKPSSADHWIPVDANMLQTIDPRGRTYPPLTFKPRILRPFSMLMLMTLCAFMMAALTFAAVYSQKHDGLTPYPGSIYSGQYFVFRILPQTLGGVILIYAQNIMAASLRIVPFATLAHEDPEKRYLALFRSLYPTTFLLPQLSGPWQLKTFGIATWLGNFTLPLLSATFTCIYVDSQGRWIWSATQGLIWVSIALYATLLVAACILMTFWFGHWTGLLWDARSIADLIPLLHRTNTMSSYRRKGLYERNCDYRAELRERWFDRLGYWQNGDMTGGVWHTIGTSAMPADCGTQVGTEPRSERRSNDHSIGSHLTVSSALLDFEGGTYLPWCLRDMPLVSLVLVTGTLLLALFIVSFLPQTKLESGFAPLLAARPDDAAFSAANFLYSFLPATLGMVLFLLFQSLDQALRILQPWGDMTSLDGAVASRSILADYAACLSLHVSVRALRNGHWRVAVVSLMSTLFIFIPILAGGLFMALTTPTQEVRMFPSMPVYGVLLAFLILYVGCSSLLIPRRRQFYLPHCVTTIASLVSLCTARDLYEDPAFRSVRSRKDLAARLGVGRKDARAESIWFFGVLAGRDEKRISVRRMKRYTEKMAMARSMTSMYFQHMASEFLPLIFRF
ncbi:uncharacterized protein MAM_02119 [Metarhizium album ARSEF 1941]|uniref:Phosphoribosylaminoimidazole-succinocarboxamide synthase n=1 Tax=Metarhizium album (strain ARSEF 1941) TaxID=1081103 RepID=A0A0B2X4G8_METAS|nr:uncharacterized protein MAM_02119 [Metarhizium album ARSEF 1941]KHO00196.1 hypothetical protein MAM_02119 [Metarhizium album ARSEF 1941]